MGVALNLPVPYSEIGWMLATTSSLDLKLQDADVWTGGIRVDARGDRFSAFLTAEGNAHTNVRVDTSSEPFEAGYLPVEWRGSNLEWWAIEGGGGVRIRGNLSVVGGMKLEHLSLKLADPVDPLGEIRFYQAYYGDRYSGDFRTKLWIPYLGIQIEGLSYGAKLLFSPVSWADVRIPFRYLYVDVPHNPYFGVTFEDAQYRFKPNGLWLAGDLHYELRVRDALRCNIWFKGSWMKIRGQGTEGYRYDELFFGIPFHNVFNDSGSAHGSYTSSVLAVGLSGTLTF